jgi:predicted metalloprotease
MRLGGERESENVEDRRGAGMPVGIAGGGLGAIAIVVIGLLLGVDPSLLLQLVGGSGPQPSSYAPQQPGQGAGGDDDLRHFVAVVLAETEDTWRDAFRAMGRTYADPKLVLYRGAVASACGTAQSAVGPFYCPGDRRVYLDLGFFRELQTRFQAPGDFAEAYVIAHEVGHHVQNLLGITERVEGARGERGDRGANGLSVRLELQADCFAGVWANQANRARNILEAGDIDEGLRAASAVGDDRLQMQARGYVVPESFTHGTSAQRARWFKRGFDRGEVRDCDTFNAANL